jgi:hypothetical protein
MLSQLTGCICNHVSLLHQYTTETLLRCVTVDINTPAVSGVSFEEV